eukprot:TRINITY_DN6010_c0_g1_i2.p2 TRINITY_DN6010_c0_g1~~TRINITY_DN6010_c0_g1_i2.p2  ORF type:complete len:390 (+),score=104.45 TRINITY_DN6010_c0_g1_i2:4069-5238(+)
MLKPPLHNIKVLDFTRLYLNYAGLFMTDLGATVYKVEDLRSRDQLHNWSPSYAKSSLYYYLLCRNKRSLAINFKTPKGIELLKGLARKTDVVIENFRPSTMARLGLDYKSLSSTNLQLIYCSISSYGSSDSRAGHAINCMAKSGLLSYSGEERPALGGGLGGDISAVSFALSGILAALLRRQTDPLKRGENIEISMANTMMTKNMLALAKYQVDKAVPENGKEMVNGALACYNTYETRDGKHVALGGTEKKFWKRFCCAIGRPDIADCDHLKQGPLQAELKNIVSRQIKSKNADEWERIFNVKDCCCNIVKSLKEAIEDPYYSNNGMIETADIAGEPLKIIRTPIRMENTESVSYAEAEEVGISTEQILKEELELKEAELKELKANGVI